MDETKKKISIGDDSYFENKSFVLRLINADSVAWNEFRNHFSPPLMGIIARIINKSDIQEDVLQTVWLKIFATIKKGRFEIGRRFFPFLSRIAVNAALDQYRKIKTEDRILDDMKRLVLVENRQHDKNSFSILLYRKQSLYNILTCLEKNWGKYATILMNLWPDFNGYDFSKCLGVHLSTAYRHIHRFIASLRECCRLHGISRKDFVTAVDECILNEKNHTNIRME
jgi:DNA-directed RNA polymerase specialized sigma24 family protein